MNNQDVLVKELATRINRLVNIPLINEQNEQIIFEIVVRLLLNLFFDELEDSLV